MEKCKGMAKKLEVMMPNLSSELQDQARDLISKYNNLM